MPSTANIVIADATPANHTLTPQQAGMALSTWKADEAATYAGNPRLAVSMSPPSKARPTTREKLTFTVPFERTVEGIITVPDSIIYTVDVVVPSACSNAEALKAYAMFKNLMANTLVQSYFAGREPVF